MREWINRLPFKKKIFGSYLLLLAFFAAGLIFYGAQQLSRMAEQSMEYMSQSNRQMNLTLETVLKDARKLKYLHFSDEELYTILVRDRENFTREELLEADEYMQKRLSQSADLGTYVLRATIETADGRVYQSLVGEQENYLNRMRRLYGRESWEDKSRILYTGVYPAKINMVDYSVVTAVTPICDISEDEPLGLLYVDIDFGRLSGELDGLLGAKKGAAQFAVLNQEEVLYHTADQSGQAYPAKLDASRLYQELLALAEGGQEGDLTIDGRSCSVSASYNGEADWVLLQYQEKSELFLALLPDLAKLLALSVLLLSLMALAAAHLAGSVSRPVQLLSGVMGKVGTGEEGEVAPIDESENVWKDEMGTLIKSYNAMARRINENIIRSYVAELNQKRTELKMLQFQINPHFLYNALNTISSIAILENVDYIPQIANSLSDMFRYNIKGKDVVTVREELGQLENYLNIQGIRFPGRFAVKIEVPEEVLSCRIIKFVLQPVVENSIHHGFAKKRKRDTLTVTGYREQGDVYLVVEDDGAGMEEEQVRRLNERLRGETPSVSLKEETKSIGLSNVNARLRNYYGGDCGIRVESRIGEYTKIILKIHGEWEEEPPGGGRVNERYEDSCSGR